MRNMYVIKFAKNGYMKYISHLDTVRLFRNTFKIAGVELAYSQGFNPHPKMSFAQPLPLGYSSTCEIIEFETVEDIEPGAIIDAMNAVIPKGIALINCERLKTGGSFAARLTAAEYEISMPYDPTRARDIGELCGGFLKQSRIPVEKRQKKTGQKKEIDIKSMIRSFSFALTDDKIILLATLDAGSVSNLSPELLIPAFVSFSGIEIAREEIDVNRSGLFFAE